ncbi:MAG: NADH-quinone oxidoreductase subunit H [Acidaminococcaceae bacterium]|nr:NADH-quinone oxidoreductase subunit H [Acidaminococcaceae bacterium]
MDYHLIYDTSLTFIQMLTIAFLAPLASGVTKKTKALLQGRKGASIFQDYNDLRKWWQKETITSPFTGPIFLLAPFIYLLTAFLAAFLLPLAETGLRLADIFVFVGVLAVGRFFMVLASFDAATAFGGMGGSRETFVAVLIEPVLFLSILLLALRTGETTISGMMGVGGLELNVSGILACTAFFILLLAENGRLPIDNPDTHLELTMIHEGMLLEYSGRLLAIIHLASMIKSLLYILLFAFLFLPLDLPLAAKALLTTIAIAIMESLNNKLRLFKIQGYLLATAGLLLLAVVAQ